VIATLSDASTITFSVVGFFVFLVLVVLLRSLMRRDSFNWRHIRIGFFIERDPKEGE